MAALIKVADNRDGYLDIIDLVRREGRKQDSRNGPTVEVDDLIIELADPSKAIPCGVGRKSYNPALGPVEALQLIGGFMDAKALVKIAPNMVNYMERNAAGSPTHFHGGYGLRLAQHSYGTDEGGQIATALNRLRKNYDTRQCVVTLWDPALDVVGGKKDHPCTIALRFAVRDGQLKMSTYMRSNDAHWGWPYDAVAFCALQLTVAAWLGLPAGSYTHHAASFHIYTKDLEALESLTPWDGLIDERVQPFIPRDTDVLWSGVMHDAARLRDLYWDADVVPAPGVWADETLWYYERISQKIRA